MYIKSDGNIAVVDRSPPLGSALADMSDAPKDPLHGKLDPTPEQWQSDEKRQDHGRQLNDTADLEMFRAVKEDNRQLRIKLAHLYEDNGHLRKVISDAAEEARNALDTDVIAKLMEIAREHDAETSRANFGFVKAMRAVAMCSTGNPSEREEGRRMLKQQGEMYMQRLAPFADHSHRIDEINHPLTKIFRNETHPCTFAHPIHGYVEDTDANEPDVSRYFYKATSAEFMRLYEAGELKSDPIPPVEDDTQRQLRRVFGPARHQGDSTPER